MNIHKYIYACVSDTEHVESFLFTLYMSVPVSNCISLSQKGGMSPKFQILVQTLYISEGITSSQARAASKANYPWQIPYAKYVT